MCACSTWSPLIWWGFFTTSLISCSMVSVRSVFSAFTRSTKVIWESLASGKIYVCVHKHTKFKNIIPDAYWMMMMSFLHSVIYCSPCFWSVFCDSSCYSIQRPQRPWPAPQTAESVASRTPEPFASRSTENKNTWLAPLSRQQHRINCCFCLRQVSGIPLCL